MNKTVTMLLIHIETSCMIFLERVVFQVYQQEKQAIRNRRQGAVFIYGKTTPVIAIPAGHIVITQIFVMGILKTGKQRHELGVGKTRQRTKTLFVVLMFGIFHATKVRTRTKYKKFN
jgi:hypothetical protein